MCKQDILANGTSLWLLLLSGFHKVILTCFSCLSLSVDPHLNAGMAQSKRIECRSKTFEMHQLASMTGRVLRRGGVLEDYCLILGYPIS
jgi:hypothetical protein